MQYLKYNYHIIATATFAVIILLAHIFAIHNYIWIEHTISHLGAQSYDRKYIMQIGFLVFGIILSVGIFLNGISLRVFPLLVYGICVAITGIFCAKPFFYTNNFSATQAMLHSTFAQIAGVAFSLGILLQIIFTTDNKLKMIHLVFFLLVIGLSAAFGLTNSYQGVLQRLLYFVSFLWLIKFYKT